VERSFRRSFDDQKTGFHRKADPIHSEATFDPGAMVGFGIVIRWVRLHDFLACA
jgi:hypothetical protein